ncbi:16337_t:CDS:2 [Racocetra fulgida]|uniref:16337_t:CDS:1 n=1 Tax=Racocetra fulgida TaxID=60492 RepID=A0A9N8YXL1_9GLOM|nr:16337_t:CDS:2 [Racocetra fulgida]
MSLILSDTENFNEKNSETDYDHIIPNQEQLAPLQISSISTQSQSTPTSPIGTQPNQYESREILPKIETKSKEMSEEYIQYERERRRNYARLLREKKRARVKELEDRAAFLEKENKRLRKNLEIYHARLAYAVPEFSFLPLENNITPEEILNLPMGFNDLSGDNLINIEDKDHDLGYFGRHNESTILK